jgi:hypothetical protein
MRSVKLRNRVAEAVARLPEAQCVEHGSHLSLEVRGRRFGWYLEDHHSDGRIALNCRSTSVETQDLVRKDPVHFHVPTYVGHRGWVGYWLDRRPKWSDVEAVLRGAYRRTAPKSLVARLLD